MLHIANILTRLRKWFLKPNIRFNGGIMARCITSEIWSVQLELKILTKMLARFLRDKFKKLWHNLKPIESTFWAIYWRISFASCYVPVANALIFAISLAVIITQKKKNEEDELEKDFHNILINVFIFIVHFQLKDARIRHRSFICSWLFGRRNSPVFSIQNIHEKIQ